MQVVVYFHEVCIMLDETAKTCKTHSGSWVSVVVVVTSPNKVLLPERVCVSCSQAVCVRVK